MPPISKVDATTAESMVELAIVAGVNLVDTADAYSGGEAEEMLAPILARHRDQLLVSTKLGFGGTAQRPLSRENVVASVHSSLRRLRTDRIDVLYLHRPDRSTPIEETFEALGELASQGLVRTVGVSNWTAWETGFAVGHQRAIGQIAPTSAQVYWSLAGREVEHEIVPMTRRLGLGLLVWSPLAGGYLAGRSEGRRASWDFPPVDSAAGGRILSELQRIAAQLGATPAQIALAWLLHRPEVTSVIIGASSREQLQDNLAAADLTLNAEQLTALEIASDIAPIYPQWWDTAMGVDGPQPTTRTEIPLRAPSRAEPA
jgi:aryl-alcohol dehydrogenase-like predicted oxidoreductase